jgi:succinoglycan biosynthesis protein ExoV
VQLFAWEGVARNFGDSLNRLLWPRLLPDFFDDDPAELFLGIGSVLDARHDASTVKLVAGAGYGGYAPLPTLDTRWIIHWVRGPRTARLLGLPDDCALGDPAMLVDRRRDADPSRIGFMPHFESAANGAWAEVAQAVGVTLIDPRDEPAGILAAIGGCRTLLSEAMHGAIVADAMRTPWVALRPLAAVHRPKWHDWADALGLQLRFHCLPASTLPEWLWATQLAACHRGRGLLRCAGPWLTGAARRRFVDRASRALAAAAAAPAQLSADAALDRCRARMMERMNAIRHSPRIPSPCISIGLAHTTTAASARRPPPSSPPRSIHRS